VTGGSIGRTGQVPDIENPVAVARRDLQVAPVATTRDEFEAFYLAHYRELMKIAMAVAMTSLGGTKQQAEDAVHQSLQKLVVKWDEVRDPLLYVRRAVINQLWENGRRAKTHRAAAPLIAQPEQRPDPGLSTYEGREWVMQKLNELSPVQKRVMALVVDDLPTNQIAELLDQSPEAVRQNLYQARKKLKASLEADAHAEAAEYRASTSSGDEVR
jgi:RNA polymerase sigma factor (sigma-70 family)